MARIEEIKNVIMGLKSQSYAQSEGSLALAVDSKNGINTDEPREQIQIIKGGKPLNTDPEAYNVGNKAEAGSEPNCIVTNPPTGTLEERKVGGPTDTICQKIRSLMGELIEGQDYFRIKGVPNAVLSKRGALKLLRRAGLTYHTTMIDKTVVVADGLLSYTMKTTISDYEGNIVAEAFGSASSLEKKFVGQGWSIESSLISISNKRSLVGAVKNLF
ncbi:hypothetical protein [Phascolarctobacterium sp.]|uniref:hypothetical protein n=1 Tax=Phascolarctobacterium sp. TaxID=2049039 RepID=UPI003870C8C6